MRKVSSAVLAGILVMVAAGWAGADGVIIPRPVPGLPAPRPLVVKNHFVTAEVRGNLATTKVDQTFVNQYDARLEGTYVFPLPPESVISNFAMYVDGKRLEGEVLDKDKARAIYEDIVRRMRDPALLEYLDRDTFRASIFPIGPREEKRVEIEYSQVLPVDNGICKYLYPLNTEKYSPEPLQEVSVAVKIESPVPIRAVWSPSHKIEHKITDPTHATAGFEAKDVLPTQDFVLLYAVSQAQFGLNLLAQRPSAEEDGYFIVFLSPQSQVQQEEIEAKDIVFVLDRSGSMDGEKIQQAREALQFCLRHLNPGDRFGLVSFATDVETYSKELLPAAQEEIAKAVKAVGEITAVGGTDLNGAVLAGLEVAKSKPEIVVAAGAGSAVARPTMVVLITDGLPTVGETDIPTILANVTRENLVGAPPSADQQANLYARLFVFGVGYDVNTQFLDGLGKDNRGVVQYVEPGEDLELAVSSFYTKVSYPVLGNLRLDFGGAGVSKAYPAMLPDLFRGSTITVFGRYKSAGRATVVLSGMARGREQVFEYPVDLPAEAKGNDFIPVLWASRRIGHLLNEIRLHGESEELKKEVVELALKYGIITEYTSYLVLEDQSAPAARRAREAGGFGGSGGGGLGGGLSADALAGPPAGPRSLEAASGKAGVDLSKQVGEMEWKGEVGGQMQQGNIVLGGRTFLFQNGYWVDTGYDEKMRVTEIKYMSEGYFRLISLNPNLAKYLAVSDRLVLRLTGNWCLRVNPDSGPEALSEEDARAIAGVNPD